MPQILLLPQVNDIMQHNPVIQTSAKPTLSNQTVREDSYKLNKVNEVLCWKWKQALGHFLSSGPMKGADMKKLVIDCIQKLKAVGLKVLVVVGD